MTELHKGLAAPCTVYAASEEPEELDVLEELEASEELDEELSDDEELLSLLLSDELFSDELSSELAGFFGEDL